MPYCCSTDRCLRTPLLLFVFIEAHIIMCVQPDGRRNVRHSDRRISMQFTIRTKTIHPFYVLLCSSAIMTFDYSFYYCVSKLVVWPKSKPNPKTVLSPFVFVFTVRQHMQNTNRECEMQRMPMYNCRCCVTQNSFIFICSREINSMCARLSIPCSCFVYAQDGWHLRIEGRTF